MVLENFKVLPFNKSEHYNLFCRWYEIRNFPKVPEDLLPPTGLVVSYDGAFVAMGFLYRTDGGIASISHLATSPVAPGDIRNEALNLLINNLILIASGEKFKLVTIATNLKKLFSRLGEHGFTKTDESVTHFGRLLWLGD